MDDRPNLFQFWHRQPPPEDVARLIGTWAGDPAFRHWLFHAETAEPYIAHHLGERARAAFRQCAVPAMQADFFRYCALLAEGGAYLDADSRNEGGLRAMLAGTGRGLLTSRRNAAEGEPPTNIINGFLFVRAAGDPLFERTLAIATCNIERRQSNNVWAVTGPGIMTGLYHDPATRPLFDGFDIRPKKAMDPAFRYVGGLRYRATEADWRVGAFFPNRGPTIYRDG